MSKESPRYTEEFKKSVVSLYHNGKTQSQLHEEYGVSPSALARWIKAYSEVKLDDNTVMSAKQVKALQKRNALLEEESIILKKAIAIFTPHARLSICYEVPDVKRKRGKKNLTSGTLFHS